HPPLHGAPDGPPPGHDGGSANAGHHAGTQADRHRRRAEGGARPVRRAARRRRERGDAGPPGAPRQGRQHAAITHHSLITAYHSEEIRPMNTTLKSLTNTQTQSATSGRIFFLDLGGGRVLSANPDGSDLRTLVEEGRDKCPDGLAVDVAAGHLYWTNMGNFRANDGSIVRSDLDGRNRTAVVPPGGTFTPKQLQIEKTAGKLYWCDRE